MHNDKGTDSPRENKPEIIQYYNNSTNGVDTPDQMAGSHIVKRMTRRLPMVVFFNILDI